MAWLVTNSCWNHCNLILPNVEILTDNPSAIVWYCRSYNQHTKERNMLYSTIYTPAQPVQLSTDTLDTTHPSSSLHTCDTTSCAHTPTTQCLPPPQNKSCTNSDLSDSTPSPLARQNHSLSPQLSACVSQVESASSLAPVRVVPLPSDTHEGNLHH